MMQWRKRLVAGAVALCLAVAATGCEVVPMPDAMINGSGGVATQDGRSLSTAERSLVERATQELAALGIEEDATVRTVEAIDWPDSSLGCPQPGMMYAQVITPGYRMVLEAGGEEYVFHASSGADANLVLCEDA